MRSIELRVAGFVAAGTIVALAAFTWIMSGVAETAARRTLEARVETLAGELARSLVMASDGTLEITRTIEEPAFDRPRSGWTWMARRNGVVVGQSRSLAGERPDPRTATDRVSRTRDLADAPDVQVEVTAPLDGIRDEVARVQRTIVLVSLLLGLVLVVGTALLIRQALKPLRALTGAIEEVREGRRDSVPETGLSNLDPVAEAVNRLSHTLRVRAERGLRDAENLAHAIKTPLSVIALRSAATGPSADPEIQASADRIARQIDLRLRRVRAAAAGTLQARSTLKGTIEDAVLVACRAHGHDRVAVRLSGDLDAAVAATREQLDEVVGAVVDNAVRHARRDVAIAAERAGGLVVVTIDDDGPGIPAERLALVRERGRRLDERPDSDGLGLAIAEEILGDIGGGLLLSNRPQGEGLSVRLDLPAA
jgi:signal transduction histidine kinase